MTDSRIVHHYEIRYVKDKNGTLTVPYRVLPENLDTHVEQLTRIYTMGAPRIALIERTLAFGQSVQVHAYGQLRNGVIVGFGRKRIDVKFVCNAIGQQQARSFNVAQLITPENPGAAYLITPENPGKEI